MENIKLTNEELNELIGGKQQSYIQDVMNLNDWPGCKCQYNNSSVIQNSNRIDECVCTCI